MSTFVLMKTDRCQILVLIGYLKMYFLSFFRFLDLEKFREIYIFLHIFETGAYNSTKFCEQLPFNEMQLPIRYHQCWGSGAQPRRGVGGGGAPHPKPLSVIYHMAETAGVY